MLVIIIVVLLKCRGLLGTEVLVCHKFQSASSPRPLGNRPPCADDGANGGAGVTAAMERTAVELI